MNRKLLNGFLVLAVAAGGVGTFTSCKDEEFRSKTEMDYESLQAQMDAIRKITDSQFKANLEAWLNSWTASASSNGFNSYDEMVQASNAMYMVYQSILSDTLSPDAQKYVQALYNWMFKDADINKNDWYDMILALANKRASSVEINQTINPVFGSINLPIGLKTTVLASYLYEGTSAAEYMFPTQVWGSTGSHLALDFDQKEANLKALATIKNLAAGKEIELKNGNYTMSSVYGDLGAVYANINPSSIDFSETKNVQLVNSRDEVVLDAANGDLVVENNTDLLSFGYSRGDQTGVYKVNANVSSDFSGVVVDLEKETGYMVDIKNAIDDFSLSNVAYLGEMLYKRMNNVLPAYALKVWWEEPVMGESDYNGTVVNSVRSAYDIAAAVIRPLSYDTPISEAFGNAGLLNKHLPVFSPLKEYLEKIGNKLTLNLQMDGIDEIEFNLKVDVKDGYVYAEDADGNMVVVGTYNADGITADQEALNDLVNAILAGANLELETSVNKDLVAQFNKAIKNINDNLGQFNAKVGDFIKFVEDSKLYDYATRLLDIYNGIAGHINKVLSNPDHYLQVVMLYSDGKAHYHILSTDPNSPTVVDPKDAGDAIELLAASYTADLAVPSYAKYVAITAVDGVEASISDNVKGGSNLNTVFPGQVHRVPVKVSNFSGKTLTITYVSVDYHGVCSMQNYYVKVK